MEFAEESVMHNQIEGIATGSPLGPALANIFVSFMSRSSYNKHMGMWIKRFISLILRSSRRCFLDYLIICIHFQDLYVKRKTMTLSFLDVSVHSSDSCFLTSVYCKPTFAGSMLAGTRFYLPIDR